MRMLTPFAVTNYYSQNISVVNRAPLRTGKFINHKVIRDGILYQGSILVVFTMPGHRSFFVPAVAENLLCRICHLPVRNAVQISVCGHRFCDSCLNSALSEMR